MGKKGKWFASVKKAFSPNSKEKKAQKSNDNLFGKEKAAQSSSTVPETVKPLPPPPQPEEIRSTQAANEQICQATSTSVASHSSSANAITSAQAVKEVVRVTKKNRFEGKSKEEAAAIRIQTAFRGYLAKRALRALRGLVRLKALMEGPVVKRQAASTLRCMQTLSRVQSQIRSRRVRMTEENQALQRQLLQKHAKELATKIGEEWDDSLQSKEQVEANLLSKYEAAMRRERAMAYSFTHQQTWKNSSKSTNPMFMDPRNPTWGWSWLERWMASRQLDSRNTTDKDLNNDQTSVKSSTRGSITGGEISKSYARFQLNSDKPSPTTTNHKINKASFPPSTPPSKPFTSSSARKIKSASPKGSISGLDDDTRSMVSMQSERNRRHSIAGSSVRDDESLVGFTGAPRYMVATESARAKTRLQSPLVGDKNGITEKLPNGSAKKRLFYPPSPAKARRHSGPPKLDSSVNTEISVTNGGES